MRRPKVVSLEDRRGEAQDEARAAARKVMELVASDVDEDEAPVVGAVGIVIALDESGDETLYVRQVGRVSTLLGAMELAKVALAAE